MLGINMQPWDIRGMPQPDGVAYIRLDGTAYLATANEGDIKEYEESDGFPFDWNESQRGNDFEGQLTGKGDLKRGCIIKVPRGRLRVS